MRTEYFAPVQGQALADSQPRRFLGRTVANVNLREYRTEPGNFGGDEPAYNWGVRSIVTIWGGTRNQRIVTGWNCSRCAWSLELQRVDIHADVAEFDLRARKEFEAHNCLSSPERAEARKGPSDSSGLMPLRLRA